MEGSNDSPPASDSPAGVSITGVPVLIPAPSLPVPLPQASTSSLADMAPPPPIPHVPTHALGAELLTPLSSHVPTHALGAESLTPLSSHAPTRALGVEGSIFPYGSTAGDTSWTNQITVYRDDWCDSSRVVYDKTRAAIMAGQRRTRPVRARVEHGTNVRRSVDSRQPNLVGAPEKRRRAPPAKAYVSKRREGAGSDASTTTPRDADPRQRVERRTPSPSEDCWYCERPLQAPGAALCESCQRVQEHPCWVCQKQPLDQRSPHCGGADGFMCG